jgi:hypothetical protein
VRNEDAEKLRMEIRQSLSEKKDEGKAEIPPVEPKA